MDKYLIISRFEDDGKNGIYNIVFKTVDEAVLKLQRLIDQWGRYVDQSHLLLTSWDDVLEFDYPSLGYAEHDPILKCITCVSNSIDYEKGEWEKQEELENKKWNMVREIAARIKLVPPKKPYVYGGEG